MWATLPFRSVSTNISKEELNARKQCNSAGQVNYCLAVSTSSSMVLTLRTFLHLSVPSKTQVTSTLGAKLASNLRAGIRLYLYFILLAVLV